MRWYFTSMLISIAFITAITMSGCSSKLHPAIKVLKYYDPTNVDIYQIQPYITNILAIDMLRNNIGLKDVREYIRWYISHLNYPDKYKLTGTIYDYDIQPNGKEFSRDTYDSVDGYAGTFLVLLYQYYLKTGDKSVIEPNKQKIFDIAYLLLYLQDSDGLVKAMPNDDSKYLMNNTEAFAGLKAFNKLAELRGWNQDASYIEAQENIKTAILTKLYNEQTATFYWAVDNEKVYESSWNNFYPDALAQLFPLLYGIVDKNSDLARYIWTEFSKRYSETAHLDIEQKVQIRILAEELAK